MHCPRNPKDVKYIMAYRLDWELEWVCKVPMVILRWVWDMKGMD